MTTSANMKIESKSGEGIISPAQGIYEQSETAKAVLGTRIKVGERVYHYARAHSATLPVGVLGVSNTVTSENDLEVAAASVGTYNVTVSSGSAWTEVDGGYLAIIDGTGKGSIYKIKSSKANATTTTYTDLVLFDPLATALEASGSTKVTIHPNPWNDIKTGSAATDPFMGVAPFEITAHYYFWMQTWGPCALKSSASTVVGSIVVHDGSGAGVIQTAYTSPIAGFQYLVGNSGDYRTVWLQIHP